MTRLAPDIQPPQSHYASNDSRARPAIVEWARPRSNRGFLIAGLAAIGLGVLAWQYLGPDLRRYLKIRSM
ncbi:MAG TPA: hypothetical protein VKW77_06215 [Acidimicrobiales bacterium]|nr:hypothetical protein [Acidimicrobiales bacterium]